jgi:hypothetical protein
MDEFRKPYEYEEERKVSGLILLFCILLIAGELFIGISILTQGYRLLRSTPTPAALFTLFGLLYLGAILFTNYALYKLPGSAVKITKLFLIYRLIYLTLAILMIFSIRAGDPRSIGPSIYQFRTREALIQNALVIPMAYTWLFTLIWYPYFLRSKRVGKTYGTPAQ